MKTLARIAYLDFVLNWKTPRAGDLFKRSSIPNLLFPTDHYYNLHGEYVGLLSNRWAKRYVLVSIRARRPVLKAKRFLRGK
jgi:hypothetical protein